MTDRLCILVIEDEPLISMMLEDFVDLLGHDLAGICDSVAGALDNVGRASFDVAILDVNLRDGPCWPVADALAAAGKPFLLATGGFVEALPIAHRDVAQLNKPYSLDDVRLALEAIGRG